ncbi:MAG: hypothetical protein WC277_06805 [Bacilli bacterium]|jgi:hypothetical protein
MTPRPAGEARRDPYTDGLILEIGEDHYIVPLHRLAALTSRRERRIPVSRRYLGVGGHYFDAEIHLSLTRSRLGHALVLWSPGAIYTIPLAELLDVVHARAQTVGISRIVTDAEILTTSNQAALEGC